MKQTKENKREEELCNAMNYVGLVLSCVNSGVLSPDEARPYILYLFKKLEIKKIGE